jgi:hypothetical protein
LTQIRKTRISEEFNKDVKLASMEASDFIASNGFTAPDNCENISCYTQKCIYTAELLFEEAGNNV